MKTAETLSKLSAILLITAFPFSGSFAEDAGDGGRAVAYRNSVAQEQLRAQTRRTRQEIVKMIEEFRRFGSAAPEIAMAEEALKKLESVGDGEMAGVVRTLREANRTEDEAELKRKMAEASRVQKEIQLTLQALADKLSVLQTEAAIEQRVKDLMMRQMANTREVEDMKNGIVRSWEIQKAVPLAVAEQRAIEKELAQLKEALKNTAGKDSLQEAKKAGEEAKMEEHAGAAATAAEAKDFNKAIEEQNKVTEGLDKMLAGLNSTKSTEERAQEAVSRLNELSALQKELARTTTSSLFGQQQVVERRQEKIADEVAALRKEVAQLNPEVGAKLDRPQQTMDQIDEALGKDRNLITNPDNKLGIVEKQNSVASDLAEAAKALQPLTGESPQGTALDGSGESDPTRQAIEDAAASVMEAQARIGMANHMMQRDGDADSTRAQLEAAQAALADAMKNAAAAGDAVGQSVQKHLGDSDRSVAGTKEKVGQGSSADQERARWGLGDADKSAAAALAQLREAAAALAASEGQGEGGKSGDSSTQSAMSGGQPGNTQHEYTSFNANAQVSNAERTALSLLQREKSSPEYNGMVQQYLKNLANGEMPGE